MSTHPPPGEPAGSTPLDNRPGGPSAKTSRQAGANPNHQDDSKETPVPNNHDGPVNGPNVSFANHHDPRFTNDLVNDTATGAATEPGMVVDGEVIGDPVDVPTEPDKGRPGAALAVNIRRAGASAVRGTGRAVTTAYTATRTVVTHQHTQRGGKAVGRNLWYPIAGLMVVVKRWRDTHGTGRYERMMRQAELVGNRELRDARGLGEPRRHREAAPP